MATANLMDFLAGDALTRLAQAFANKKGVMRPLPASVYTPTNNPNVGTIVSWDVVTPSREAAQITNPDSPPNNVQGVATANKKATGIGARESYQIGATMIAMLQAGGIIANNARMELERQIDSFTGRFVTLDSDMVHSMLLRGKIDVSTAGVIQTSTSSPRVTIDCSSPTGNSLTTDGSGSTYTIGDWSSSSTDIVSAVTNLDVYAAKTYSTGIDDIYYGPSVPGYLAKNTTFQQYLKLNPQFNNGYVSSGQISNGVLGKNWIPVAKATKVVSGTGTAWAGASFLMATPTLDTSWYEFVSCGLPCPKGLTSESDLRDAMLSPEGLSSAFPITYGIHSYALMNARNVSAELIVANYKLPIIKSPNVVFRGVCA